MCGVDPYEHGGELPGLVSRSGTGGGMGASPLQLQLCSGFSP